MIDVPSTPIASPATVKGRHSCRPGTVNASTTAIIQPAAITTMTGQGLSKTAGRAGGSGATLTTYRMAAASEIDRGFRGFPETP
jgi:hypothetical protein